MNISEVTYEALTPKLNFHNNNNNNNNEKQKKKNRKKERKNSTPVFQKRFYF